MNKVTDSFKQNTNKKTHSKKRSMKDDDYAKEKKMQNKSKSNSNKQRGISNHEINQQTLKTSKKHQESVTEKKLKKKKRKKLTPEQMEILRKKRKKETIIEVIKFLIPILIVAALVFLFILNTSSHMVDGNSMNPTLQDGDRVIVTRTKEFKRYEVITFKPPVKSEYQYVKRIIGMPGDLISTDGNFLFINHQAKSLPEQLDFSSASELPDGTIKVDISDEVFEQLSTLNKIPDKHYFVLGDNRNNSSDSREFGLVAENAIEGVVSYRFSPFKDMGWIR